MIPAAAILCPQSNCRFITVLRRDMIAAGKVIRRE